MSPRYDVKIKDILTISSISVRKNTSFLYYIRPLYKNFLTNTVFKWEYGGSRVNISGNWDFWEKTTQLKKSGGEFTTILPLIPGRFQYRFSIATEKRVLSVQTKKSPFLTNFNGFKTVKRLDKEIISSDSLLDYEMKLFPYFRQFSQINFNEVNKSPQYIPSQLLASMYTKKVHRKKPSKSDHFISETEASKKVFFNHLIFYGGSVSRMKNQEEIIFIKIRFEEKTCSFFYVGKKRISSNIAFHPIKCFFNHTAGNIKKNL